VKIEYGAPNRFAKMSDAELHRFIIDEAQALGINLSGTPKAGPKTKHQAIARARGPWPFERSEGFRRTARYQEGPFARRFLRYSEAYCEAGVHSCVTGLRACFTRQVSRKHSRNRAGVLSSLLSHRSNRARASHPDRMVGGTSPVMAPAREAVSRPSFFAKHV
jgi:hypothetical protein